MRDSFLYPPNTRRHRVLLKAGVFIMYPFLMVLATAAMIIGMVMMFLVWPLIPFCEVRVKGNDWSLRLPWRKGEDDA